MKLKYAVILLCSLYLTACAVDPVRQSGGQIPLTDQNRGYALLSMGPAKAPGYVSHYNVLLKEKSGTNVVSVLYTKDAIFVKATHPDFVNETGEGALYLVPLAAGEYEVHRVRIFLTNSYEAFSPVVSLPFTVRPSEVTYIGRFMIEPNWPGGNMFLQPQALRAGYSSEYELDVEIARKKFSTEIANLKITKKP